MSKELEKNRCYTYFSIDGDFDPDDVSALLNLTPTRSFKTGDLRRTGSMYNFSSWQFGLCEEYDILVENQMRKTIAPLLDKIDLLCAFRASHDVSFFLEVVPTMYPGNDTPVISPPLDIIDFCHATRTNIDIDYYVMWPGEEDDDDD